MPVYMVVIAQMPDKPDGRSSYGAAVAKHVPKYGGEYLVRGGPAQLLEGEWMDRTRLVISRWPDMDAVNRFWASPEYQQDIKPLRKGTGVYDVALFEGER